MMRSSTAWPSSRSVTPAAPSQRKTRPRGAAARRNRSAAPARRSSPPSERGRPRWWSCPRRAGRGDDHRPGGSAAQPERRAQRPHALGEGAQRASAPHSLPPGAAPSRPRRSIGTRARFGIPSAGGPRRRSGSCCPPARGTRSPGGRTGRRAPGPPRRTGHLGEGRDSRHGGGESTRASGFSIAFCETVAASAPDLLQQDRGASAAALQAP